MALGVLIDRWNAKQLEQCGSLTAGRGTFIGGSTPTEGRPHLKFAASPAQYVDVYGRMPGVLQYTGVIGVTLELLFGAESATSNNMIWRGAFRQLALDSDALSTAHTYSTQSATVTVPGGTGRVVRATIPFTNAQMDGVVAGDEFVLRISRNGGTASGNGLLYAARLFETVN